MAGAGAGAVATNAVVGAGLRTAFGLGAALGFGATLGSGLGVGATSSRMRGGAAWTFDLATLDADVRADFFAGTLFARALPAGRFFAPALRLREAALLVFVLPAAEPAFAFAFFVRVVAAGARFAAFLVFFLAFLAFATTNSLSDLSSLAGIAKCVDCAYRVASASRPNTEKTSGFRSRL